MADQKISELTNITGANLANADEFVVVDSSADQTKAITFGELKEAFDTGTGFVRITGDTMTGDLSFGDNDKAIFGAGSDLQIYHDGSNSYIKDAGAGNLSVLANVFRVYNAAGDELSANFVQNGAVTLYHDGAQKLSTSNTGVTVTGNARFFDNDKALFGDGNDLQIYHNGTNSIISDAGSGSLSLQSNGSEVNIWDSSNGQHMAQFQTGGKVVLRHNGDTKLETTSTGVDISGALTSDGLSVSNSGNLTALLDSTSGTPKLQFRSSGGSLSSYIQHGVGGTANLSFQTNGTTERMSIEANGDISFYEDTGTTPKFFWDASAESLTLTGQKDSTSLNLSASLVTVGGGTLADYNQIYFDNTSGTGDAYIRHYANAHQDSHSALAFGTANNGSLAERMRIDSSGKVGIGTSSPDGNSNVQIQNDTGNALLRLRSSTTGLSGVDFGDSGDIDIGGIRYNNSSNYMYFNTNASEAMRIDSSGNVGIGTSSPSEALHVYDSSSATDNHGIRNSTYRPHLTLEDLSVNVNDWQVWADSGNLSFLTGDISASGTNGAKLPNERMTLDSSGNVGIGTDSPASLVSGGSSPVLTIGGTDSSLIRHEKAGALSFITNDGSYSNTFPDGITGEIVSVCESDFGSAYGLAFYTGIITDSNRGERVRIDRLGRVGIGTTSPTADLEISAASNPEISIASTAGATSNFLNFKATSHTQQIQTQLKTVDNGDFTSDLAFLFKGTGTAGALSEKIRIDSSGRVGIGTSSPTNELEVHSAGDTTVLVKTSGTGDADATLQLDSAASGESMVEFMHDGVSGAGIQWFTDGGPDLNIFTSAGTDGQIDFQPNNSLAMRIDSSGNVLVGQSSTTIPGIYNTTVGHSLHNQGYAVHSRNNAQSLYINRSGTNGTLAQFNKDGNPVGNISVTGSSTSYNTSSDYRLKTNAQPMTGASARVQALNPVNFEWIADGTRVDGFLAHEAQEVVPEAVTGTKDAMDADGNPDYQGVDQSKLVPLLTAALQEALTRIDALETRITTLEG